MPKVSVIIPAYNSEKYIAEAINSVLAQMYQDFELVICDDCSKDRSVDIIKSYSDSRIRCFVNEKNLGMAGNWNKCVQLARGEIVNIFHYDDIMLPNNIENNLRFLDSNPSVGLVHSNMISIDENGMEIGGHFALNPKEDTILGGFECFNRLISEGNYICCPSVYLRRVCYDRLGLYDSRFIYVLDMEMWSRIALSYDFGYIAKPLIKYRTHTLQATESFRKDNIRKGDIQESLAVESALAHYHKSQYEGRIAKARLAELAYRTGFSLFDCDDFLDARRLFKRSFTYRLNVKALLHYGASFFPVRWIKWMRRIKRKFYGQRTQ